MIWHHIDTKLVQKRLYKKAESYPLTDDSLLFCLCSCAFLRGSNEVIADAKEQGRKGLVLTCKDRPVHYYAKFGFADEGVTDKSTHGNVSWHQMRLTFWCETHAACNSSFRFSLYPCNRNEPPDFSEGSCILVCIGFVCELLCVQFMSGQEKSYPFIPILA